MRHFSILQTALAVVLDPDKPATSLTFTEDPNDSSIMRLRVASAESDNAVELTFDRNGRQRGSRLWPTRYPAWSDKEPADLDKEAEIAALAADQAAAEAADTEKPAGRGKAKAK